LHLCRGAIVLLSPAALESAWVSKETAILGHRHDIAPTFPLIPVRVAGVEPDDLTGADWEPVAISELMSVMIDDAAVAPKPVLDRLRPLLQRHAADSPERRLENHLVQCLSAVTHGALQSAAEKLELPFSEWEIDGDRPTAYARRLLEVPIERQVESLDLIADADPEVAHEVFVAVAPHGWIAAEATSAVRAIAAAPPRCRGLGLNTAETATCEMYARGGFFDWESCPVEGAFSELSGAEVIDRTRAVLVRWLGDDEDEDPPDDATIDAFVLTSQASLPFVVLPAEVKSEHVAALRDVWPHVPLMVRCGAETEEDFRRRSLQDVLYMRPPIDGQRESAALTLSASSRRDYKRRLRRRGTR
jgi:hypothetical protein